VFLSNLAPAKKKYTVMPFFAESCHDFPLILKWPRLAFIALQKDNPFLKYFTHFTKTAYLPCLKFKISQSEFYKNLFISMIVEGNCFTPCSFSLLTSLFPSPLVKKGNLLK
jgi:hypothetical protein